MLLLNIIILMRILVAIEAFRVFFLKFAIFATNLKVKFVKLC